MIYNVRLATNPSGAPFMVDTNLQTVSQDISADVKVSARDVAAAAITEMLARSRTAPFVIGHMGMRIGKIVAMVTWKDTNELVAFDVMDECTGQHPSDLVDDLHDYFVGETRCGWSKAGSVITLTSRK